MKKAAFICISLCFLPFLCARAAKPMTFEEAQAMALAKVPGTVVDTERSIHNGAVVFEFDIKEENGAVMEIEIDSVTREILRLKINKTGTGGSLPEPVVSAEDAQVTAIKNIEQTTSGLRAVEVVDATYKIEKQVLAHIFTLKRGITEYRVVVDATTGKVLSSEEKR